MSIISTDEPPTDDGRQIAVLRRQVDYLTTELDLAQLHTEVAISAISLFDQMFDDLNDRATVIADVVSCWLRLTPEVFSTYLSAPPPRTGIHRFALDYSTVIEESPFTDEDEPTPDAPGDGTFEESERLVKQAWERHVVAIRERTDRCEPPAAAWLAQFPLPKTP